jgi:hypothetical protein
MLETMLSDRKSWTNTRTLNQIIQQLKENTYLADIIAEDENFRMYYLGFRHSLITK